MSATASSAAAAATSDGPRAPPQAGIFEGLNPSKFNPSDPLVLFVIQASIVIALCRLLYWPLSKIRQPPVIAEVIAGILLGPSAFGRIPGFTTAIFPREGMAPFTLAANIGLILYLFLVGLEIDLRFLSSNWRIAVSVASLDMAIPFGLGYALAYGVYNQFQGDQNIVEINFATYGLFVAIAIAITAFPVLCRILGSLHLLNSNVGVITLSSGIANDVVGWVLLALCVTLVNAGNGITALWVFLTAVGFALFLAFAVRPVFLWILKKTHSMENGPTQGVVALTLLMVFASAFFTSVIGAHSVFGAFMVGLMCPHDGGFAIKLTEKLEDIVAVFFLPLFFARSGLNTNLALLDSGIVWGYVVAIIVVAMFSKILGGTLGARLNGLFWRESFTIGIFMSCKGLVELIVLNIGFQARILSTRTFTMFVVMALVTTFLTTPLATWIYPVSYQRKLKLFREGKIDWEGNSLQSEDPDYDLVKRTQVVDRLFVYVRADGLSSLFSLMKLFTAAPAHSPSSGTDPAEKDITTTGVQETPTSNSPSHPLRIHAARLTQFSERDSSVMKISEHDDDASNDPIIKAFASTAQNTGRQVTLSTRAVVVPGDKFAETITSYAADAQSDLILIPWSETGSASDLPSYFVRSSRLDPLENRDFARLTSDIFERARRIASVGIYLDSSLLQHASHSRSTSTAPPTADAPFIPTLSRTRTHTSVRSIAADPTTTYPATLPAGHTHLIALYAGGPDDLYAVKLAMQLARNGGHATVLDVRRGGAASPASGGANGAGDAAAHAADTAFADLQSHMAAALAGRVLFEALEDGTLSAEVVAGVLGRRAEGGGTAGAVFIVGRSVGEVGGGSGGGGSGGIGSAGGSSAVGEGEIGSGTLGVVAAGLLRILTGAGKGAGLKAGVLVVQGKEE